MPKPELDKNMIEIEAYSDPKTQDDFNQLFNAIISLVKNGAMDKGKFVKAANNFLEKEKSKFSREDCEKIAEKLNYLKLIVEPEAGSGRALPVQEPTEAYSRVLPFQEQSELYEAYEEDCEEDIYEEEDDDEPIEEVMTIKCVGCEKELCVVGVTESGLELMEAHFESFGYMCFDCPDGCRSKARGGSGVNQ